MPDLETYKKIFRWLKIVMPEVSEELEVAAPQVHFRREKTVSAEAAQSLAQMILSAQAAWGLSKSIEDQNCLPNAAGSNPFFELLNIDSGIGQQSVIACN